MNGDRAQKKVVGFGKSPIFFAAEAASLSISTKRKLSEYHYYRTVGSGSFLSPPKESRAALFIAANFYRHGKLFYSRRNADSLDLARNQTKPHCVLQKNRTCPAIGISPVFLYFCLFFAILRKLRRMIAKTNPYITFWDF